MPKIDALQNEKPELIPLNSIWRLYITLVLWSSRLLAIFFFKCLIILFTPYLSSCHRNRPLCERSLVNFGSNNWTAKAYSSSARKNQKGLLFHSQSYVQKNLIFLFLKLYFLRPVRNRLFFFILSSPVGAYMWNVG